MGFIGKGGSNFLWYHLKGGLLSFFCCTGFDKFHQVVCGLMWCFWLGLVQRQIAYFSKALSPRTESDHVKIIMSLVLAFQCWKHYLMGNSFKVLISHGAWSIYSAKELPLLTNNVGHPSFWGTNLMLWNKPGPGNRWHIKKTCYCRIGNTHEFALVGFSKSKDEI